ncbi:hypothetical protein [Streptomyces sp. SM12]|uniref:hypothetical protein n=1 Tax=Streptomyces sp. SM12 TaxID=1071602 RepID=UPI000CD53784|nr:hypothetical protein [Streptomyces sp. SM12]
MSLPSTIQISQLELVEILTRLKPHLPPSLTAVDAKQGRLLCHFTAFTGREATPLAPYLTTKEFEDTEEFHRLSTVLGDIYDQAHAEWEVAAFTADMTAVIGDTPECWTTYKAARQSLDAAYDYLRSPDASQEWPSAISRLVDCQERTLAAANAFDARALEIARVTQKHLYSAYNRADALRAAGHPEGADWPIADLDAYTSTWVEQTLAESVRQLISTQETHVTKVSRLAAQ